jgi:PPOX class probable F420-dependent enzyme
MSFDPAHLPESAGPFLTERHLATLTTLRADGTPHVVPVGFTWDGEQRIARVITSGGSLKARNAARAGARAALCQLEGRYWLTLEGTVQVRTDREAVLDAEARYTARYRPPRVNPERVVLEIAVDRVLGSLPDQVPPSSQPSQNVNDE